jgi:sugar lactone lactonase YvrE
VLRRIALGLVLLGALFGAFRVADGLKRRQLVGAIGTGLMSILVVYAIHTGWQLTYKNGDTPVEMAVYVQSSPDIPFIVSEIERFGNQTGQRKELPILLDGGYTETDASGQQVPHEAVSWPFEWYFRDFKGKQYYTKSLPSDFSSGRFAALLVMGTNLDPIRDQLSGYTGNKFRLNWWYPEDYKQLTLSTIWETLIDPVARGKLIKYILYRELINPPLGARELWFYVRNDLAGGGGTGAPAAAGTAPVAPAGPAPAARAELVVQAVTSYGRPGGQAALRDPKGFTLDREGRLYVVDAGNNNVVVFNPDGTVARMLGRPGSGDGELKEPWGIAVAADGSIFVADTWNHRIQKFDAEGRFITKWGIFEASTAPNALYGPRDIAINAAGELLITDTGNKRIQVFDQAGKHLRSFGAEGAGPGQFREPVGVAVDRQGRIYVADTWNQRIQVFNATFQPIAQYPVPGWGSQSLVNKPYLAVSAEGDIYATSPERGSVIRIRDGVVTALVLPASPRLEAPTGIHIEGERLLISDARTASVVAYDLDLKAEQDSADSE